MGELADLAERAETQDAFAGLAALQRLRSEANRHEAVLVRRARNAGASWAQIAQALGITKQAVHKRYGRSR